MLLMIASRTSVHLPLLVSVVFGGRGGCRGDGQSHHVIILSAFYSDLTRVFTPKWWFSKGNPRLFQGNLGW